MKTKVTFTATSKNTGKNFTITVDLNNVKNGWFVEELNKSITDRDMMANFTGYWATVRNEFRLQNEGKQVEIKKRIGNYCVSYDVYADGIKMSEEIQMAIFDSANEGIVKIERERIINIKNSDLKEVTKENY